jgi:hypothetical protein
MSLPMAAGRHEERLGGRNERTSNAYEFRAGRANATRARCELRGSVLDTAVVCRARFGPHALGELRALC